MATAAAENTSAPAPEQEPKSGKRKFMLIGLAIVVVILALGIWAWYEIYGQWSEETDDAYVNGNVVEITPLVTGTVISIGADDGDLVHAGQVLLKFDPSDAEVSLQSAEANLGKVVRQVRGLYSNVDGMKAQLAAQRAAVQTAQDNYNRRRSLAAGGAISQEELSHARDSLTSAQSALNNIQQQLSTSVALVDDTVVSSHPDVKAAAAQLRQAYLANARSTLVAPVTGYVAKRTVQLGQRIQPGTATMAVIPLDQLWIDANFKETQLGKMRIGQPVEISSDLYGSDVKYNGTIDSLGPAPAVPLHCCLRRTPLATGSRLSSVCRCGCTSTLKNWRSTHCASACRPRLRSTCTTRAVRSWRNSRASRPLSALRCTPSNWLTPTR